MITLAALIAVFSVLSPYFLQVNNTMNIARSVSISGITAAGETMVLVSGGVDLWVGSVTAASGMVVSSLIMNSDRGSEGTWEDNTRNQPQPGTYPPDS